MTAPVEYQFCLSQLFLPSSLSLTGNTVSQPCAMKRRAVKAISSMYIWLLVLTSDVNRCVLSGDGFVAPPTLKPHWSRHLLIGCSCSVFIALWKYVQHPCWQMYTIQWNRQRKFKTDVFDVPSVSHQIPARPRCQRWERRAAHVSRRLRAECVLRDVVSFLLSFVWIVCDKPFNTAAVLPFAKATNASEEGANEEVKGRCTRIERQISFFCLWIFF